MSKRTVITYGTFDLLHFGHIALLERAKSLGDYLIVGITSDAFDKSRGKFNVQQPLAERIEAVRETGIVDKIIVEEFRGQKIDDIKKHCVDVFAIGSDWQGRFDYLEEYCEVVYLERTKGVSSTELRAQQSDSLSVGCIGFDYLSERIIRESNYVSGLDFTCGFDPCNAQTKLPRSYAALEIKESTKEVYKGVDAVYINIPLQYRHEIIVEALQANCHVLCEGPIAISVEKANYLFALAEERALIIQESLGTAYLPGFQRLKLMLESGIIGELVDIDASFTHVFSELDKNDKYQGSFYNMSSRATIPAFSFLGSDFLSSELVCSFEGSFCTWSKLNLTYPSASATIKIGRGIKTEGDMTITGTNGYIYVPAPWWKLEYFELRYEDLRNSKKYFFEFLGEGQRYLLKCFFDQITKRVDGVHVAIPPEHTLSSINLIERFDKADFTKLKDASFRFGGGEQLN